jgi:two-component system response regulator FixJ
MSSEFIVHVVDDDAAVRHSLAFLLATVGLPTRLHETAESFLSVAQAGAISGCVVTDVRMPGMDGLELQRELKQRGHTLPVIVITGHGDVPLAVAAMKEGAFDFIEKPFDDAVIISSVRSALDRHRAAAKGEGEAAEARSRLSALSQRERQVLDGVVEGLPNKSIAAQLGISPRTVEIYRSHLMMKMQTDSLSQLIRLALLAGITPRGASRPLAD